MSEEDEKTLKIFSVNSKKLHDAVKKHIPEKTTIKYAVNKPTKVEGEVDETTEAGLVANARLFIGNNVTEFKTVVNILSRHYQNDRSKVERLRKYKKAWEKAFDVHPLFRIGSEQDGWTNEKIFKTIAYGGYLHSSKDKFDEHFKLKNSWVYPVAKIQLQSLILNIQGLTTMLNKEFVEPLISAKKK